MTIVRYDRKGAHFGVKLNCPEDEGRTQQQFTDECNVNNIVKRYNDTGIIDRLAKGQRQYGEVSAKSFREAMVIVAESKSAFEHLTATTRAYFGNDVLNFLDAAQDPERRPEFVELGLLEALAEEKPAELVEEPGEAPTAPLVPPTVTAAEPPD